MGAEQRLAKAALLRRRQRSASDAQSVGGEFLMLLCAGSTARLKSLGRLGLRLHGLLCHWWQAFSAVR